MDQQKIGSFIAELRKERNMTQVQLAEQLGVTNKAVSKWENGKSLPDIQLFQPICTLFHISVNELLAGEHIQQEEVQYKTTHFLLEYILLTKNILKLSVISFVLIGIGVLLLFFSFITYKADMAIRILNCSIGLITIFIGIYINFIIKININANKVYNYLNKKIGHTKLFMIGLIMEILSLNIYNLISLENGTSGLKMIVNIIAFLLCFIGTNFIVIACNIKFSSNLRKK